MEEEFKEQCLLWKIMKSNLEKNMLPKLCLKSGILNNFSKME